MVINPVSDESDGYCNLGWMCFSNFLIRIYSFGHWKEFYHGSGGSCLVFKYRDSFIDCRVMNIQIGDVTSGSALFIKTKNHVRACPLLNPHVYILFLLNSSNILTNLIA